MEVYKVSGMMHINVIKNANEIRWVKDFWYSVDGISQ